ncbi:hypothetical protein HHI36_006935 [Cryptolaemus montrouzieri]|uniref:Uncharacterized protein n=1 Tax=Cryptolaemus montrouzieri TaxID=559131 RepID=A0ABD2MNA8_9CUCU
MLVEDCSYLTSKKCFDDHTNNKVAKIAMIQQDRPSFGSLEYESYILRFKDLDNLVVLQRDGITLILDEHFNTNFGNSTNKDPYAIDELKQPRVLLTYPGNARFTHCYCLGWGSSSKTYESLETLKLKFQLSRVHSTKLTDEGKSILIELEEDEPKVDDFGSPLICEVRQGPAVLGAAVIGIYKDGDSKFSTLHNSLSVYVSFSGTLGHLTRWAIGTNVSVSGKLEEWTLWPEKPSKDRPNGIEDSSDSKDGSIFTTIMTTTTTEATTTLKTDICIQNKEWYAEGAQIPKKNGNAKVFIA